ncbi:MAG TPA: DUF262 domain-containing protein, partial [Leptospiraceae bacterium]|nr:DUF262 domain-containing protein [Leptospiraceae bacterium]
MNDNIRFEAARVELYKLFSEVKGFYIPEYQRPFTWTVEHAGRLFDTIENAIESSINEPYYAFLGAILVMDNIDELENNYPIVRDESPSSVYAVIDGQQRITSLILLMTEVYKKLLEMNKNLENFEINSEFKGKLQGAINKTVEALFVKNDWINKENKVAYLPKIINGYYNDEWKKQVEGIYRSPISKLLLGL